MTRKRVVIDTNVVISAFLFEASTPAQVFDAVYENHILLFSSDTYTELCEVLLRPKFDRYALREERINFLVTFSQLATEIAVHTEVAICRDPKDDKFLALAVDGKANYIVSSDQDLRDLGSFNAVPILTPREFYETVLEE